MYILSGFFPLWKKPDFFSKFLKTFFPQDVVKMCLPQHRMLLFSGFFAKKDAKNRKIFQKRVLTIKTVSAIIIKRAAERP